MAGISSTSIKLILSVSLDSVGEYGKISHEGARASKSANPFIWSPNVALYHAYLLLKTNYWPTSTLTLPYSHAAYLAIINASLSWE